jgi:hypothetical protein
MIGFFEIIMIFLYPKIQQVLQLPMVIPLFLILRGNWPMIKAIIKLFVLNYITLILLN